MSVVLSTLLSMEKENNTATTNNNNTVDDDVEKERTRLCAKVLESITVKRRLLCI